MREALKIGGHGYVTNPMRLELLQAIRAVREGQSYVSQRIIKEQGIDSLTPETA